MISTSDCTSIFVLSLCVLYSKTMDEEIQKQWILRLRQSGLLGLAEVSFAVMQPISPLMAQMLYVAQPVTRKFGQQHTLLQFAELLEDQDAFAQFRVRLADDHADQQDHRDQQDRSK